MAIFRLNNPESAEIASQTLGEAERERTEESARYGANVGYESFNLGTRRDVERLVLPTEIISLPDLSCYVRLPSGYPIARTTLPDPAKTERPRRHPGFEEADPYDTVEAHLARSGEMPASTDAPPEGPTPERTDEETAHDPETGEIKRATRTPEEIIVFTPSLDGTDLEHYPH
jgi:type IV secretory pathway TraG/TraD family ATPase VirD4